MGLKIECHTCQECGKLPHTIAFIVVLYLTEQGVTPTVQYPTYRACYVVVVKYRIRRFNFRLADAAAVPLLSQQS